MDIPSLAITVVPAVISILIGLAIGAVGYIIAALNETRKWKRQQRLELYLDIVRLQKNLRSNSNGIIKASTKLFDKRKQGTLSEDELQELKDVVKHFGEASSTVLIQIDTQMAICRILGTTGITEAVDKYGKAATALFKHEVDLVDSAESRDSLEKLQGDSDRAWLLFLDQAQRDLGLKHWWNKHP